MVNEKKRKKEEWLRKRKEWEDGIKERYVQTNELPPCLTKHNIYRERKKIEFAQNKKKWDEQKERELGRKIFVGGFKFDDLTEEGNIFDDFLISRINLPSSLLLKLLVRQLLLNSLPRGGEDFWNRYSLALVKWRRYENTGTRTSYSCCTYYLPMLLLLSAPSHNFLNGMLYSIIRCESNTFSYFVGQNS